MSWTVLYLQGDQRGLSVSVWKTLDTHMSSREAAKMGDILATEADLLGMIKEVINETPGEVYSVIRKPCWALFMSV